MYIYSVHMLLVSAHLHWLVWELDADCQGAIYMRICMD